MFIILVLISLFSTNIFASFKKNQNLISSEDTQIGINCILKGVDKSGQCLTVQFFRQGRNNNCVVSTPVELSELNYAADKASKNIPSDKYVSSIAFAIKVQNSFGLSDDNSPDRNALIFPLIVIYIPIAYPITGVIDLIKSPFVLVSNLLDEDQTSVETALDNINFLINNSTDNKVKNVSSKEFEIINQIAFGYDDKKIIGECARAQ